MPMTPLLEVARDFYFGFMLACYAGDKEPETIYDFPGDQHGKKRYVHGDPHGWYGIDEWTSGDHGSCGLTRIFNQGKLIWSMSYDGYYPDEALPCLKAALQETFQEKRFIGGRGPLHFQLKQFEYFNEQPSRGEFWFGNFHGRESIVTRPNGSIPVPLGAHRYSGRSHV